MFSLMSATPKPFDSEAPAGSRRPIIRYRPETLAQKEMVDANWGTDPRFGDGVSYRFVRSEGQTFPSHRCLVPASEFQLKVGDHRYRVTRDDGNFFYLAGVWEPALGDWPLAFKIITVEASSEVSRYQERHGAMIQRSQVMQWLDATVPEVDLLVTPPTRTFVVEEIGAKPVQRALAV